MIARERAHMMRHTQPLNPPLPPLPLMLGVREKWEQVGEKIGEKEGWGACLVLRAGSQANPKFTCFAGTKVQILTLTRLPGGEIVDDSILNHRDYESITLMRYMHVSLSLSISILVRECVTVCIVMRIRSLISHMLYLRSLSHAIFIACGYYLIAALKISHIACAILKVLTCYLYSVRLLLTAALKVSHFSYVIRKVSHMLSL